MSEPVQFMSQMTAVEYKLPETSLLARHIAEAIADGRIIGHKCPQCGQVYVPPRGYCPLCVDPDRRRRRGRHRSRTARSPRSR